MAEKTCSIFWQCTYILGVAKNNHVSIAGLVGIIMGSLSGDPIWGWWIPKTPIDQQHVYMASWSARASILLPVNTPDTLIVIWSHQRTGSVYRMVILFMSVLLEWGERGGWFKYIFGDLSSKLLKFCDCWYPLWPSSGQNTFVNTWNW